MKLTITNCILLLALPALLLAACQPKVPEMTPEETQRIEALTARLTPRCIGRYLIDLPESFVLNSIATAKLEEVEIKIEPMPHHQFDREFRERSEVLKKERIMGKDTASLLSITPLPDGAGQVFNRSEDRILMSSRTLELIAWRNGYRIEMLIEATDMSFVAERVYESDTRIDTAEKLTHLLKVYERVRGRADNEVPTEKGVCFANGFLRGAATDQEQIDQYYHLSTAEDVYFSFNYLSDIGPEKTTLLERGHAIEKSLAKHNGGTLRKGKREGNGLTYEEWLMVQESESGSGANFYDMTLESNSKEGNATKPLFVADFTSGVRYPRPRPSLEESAVEKPIAKATLGEAESVALWDKVTPTLRPRPGAF